MNRFTRLFIYTLVMYSTIICNDTLILGQSHVKYSYRLNEAGTAYTENQLLELYAKTPYEFVDKIPYKDFISFLLFAKPDTADRLQLTSDDEIMVKLLHKSRGLPKSYYKINSDGTVTINTIPAAIIKRGSSYYVKLDIWGMENYELVGLLNQLVRNGYYYDGFNNDLNRNGKPWRTGQDTYFTIRLGKN